MSKTKISENVLDTKTNNEVTKKYQAMGCTFHLMKKKLLLKLN